MKICDKNRGTVPDQCAIFSKFLPYSSKVACINILQHCLVGLLPTLTYCDGQMFLKIKNPSNNFCEVWSEDHLSPFWCRLVKMCGFRNFFDFSWNHGFDLLVARVYEGVTWNLTWQESGYCPWSVCQILFHHTVQWAATDFNGSRIIRWKHNGSLLSTQLLYRLELKPGNEFSPTGKQIRHGAGIRRPGHQAAVQTGQNAAKVQVLLMIS